MVTVSDSVLDELTHKAKFIDLVHQAFYDLSSEFGLVPHFNRAMAQDAYFLWMDDLKRIRNHEERVKEPDHIKKCAHLIYWLRRSSPVNDFARNDIEGAVEIDAEAIEFMMKYGREYLAFDYGYQIARHFERSIEGREISTDAFSLQSSLPEVPDHDFLRTVTHVMKTKMLSPQALVITLKAIFLRP